MRLNWCTIVFSLVMTGIMVHGALADTVLPGDAIYQVHVDSVTLDPQVFFPNETGTVTIELVNSGNQTVSLSDPTILDTQLMTLNSNSYTSVVHLGPNNTMTYSFLVSPQEPAGTYFPLFTVSTVEAGSISYPFQLEVDSRNISVIVTDKPDNFSLGTESTVNLTIVNPRDGPVKNIIITPSGSGFDIVPDQVFISSLDSGASQIASFQVTPNRESTIGFHVTYENGDNLHTADLVLPLNLGVNKLAAVPIINDVALTAQNGGYQLTGDVSNAGVTDASGMVLTVNSPANPIEPYTEYAVGSLASDDFSSFTLTFTTANLADVPVEIQWKDADGNSFSTVTILDLTTLNNSTSHRSSGFFGFGASATTSIAQGAGGGGRVPTGGGGIFGFGGSRGGGVSAFYPVIFGGVIIVATIVAWRWRKQIVRKLKKK